MKHVLLLLMALSPMVAKSAGDKVPSVVFRAGTAGPEVDQFKFEPGAKLYFLEDGMRYESETTVKEISYDDADVIEFVINEESPYDSIEEIAAKVTGPSMAYDSCSGTVTVLGTEDVRQMNVYTFNGQLALSASGTSSINVAALSNGAYLVVAYTAEGTVTRKLFIH